MSTSETTADLEREVARLVHRLRGVSPAWFAARTTAGSRGEVLASVLRDLAAAGAAAGCGAPAGVPVPVLADHALADQLVVLTRELLDAPGAERAAAPALAAVRGARAVIDAPGGLRRA